ncbi:MAG: M24 family metallopeptidase [Chitinophagaceae bacterium]|nr:MAG: M24 family metallopeptidase [Chitinophagaceae bacterium]
MLFTRTRLLLAGLLIAGPLMAQTDLPTDYLTPAFHASRRDALRQAMPDSSVTVVFAYPTRVFSQDVDYFYHQNPDLYYFTGYKEPHSVLLVFKEPQVDSAGNSFSEILFVQKRDPQGEQWTGRRLGIEGVQQKLGIKTVMNGSAFKSFGVDLSSFNKILLEGLPIDVPDNAFDKADLADLISQFREKSKAPADYKKDKRFDLREYNRITGALREVKTQEELLLLRKAVEISCLGQNEVMKTVRPDMSELEIQGLHEYIHKRYGAEGVGYGSIVGAGENGCILHYMENTKTKVGSSLLLMDVGAEYHGYSADVTRTIPANGKFSENEKIIYQLVYDAQEAAFKTLKDGSTWAEAEKVSRDIVANGLIRLGIAKDKADARKYYPHGLGHHIGLDVHDRSNYGKLQKDMVITIEPGIYIPEGSKCDKKWWSIAVRIEDDALITKDGYELLSAFAPRSIEAIEKMIAESSVLDKYKLAPLKSSEKKGF